jgi:hypothetical protein
MTSALLALFLSRLYSSFFRPIVRRMMTSSRPVGNLLSVLSKMISTVSCMSKREEEVMKRYHRQIGWSSQKRLHVEALDVLRETLKYMHRRGRTEWLTRYNLSISRQRRIFEETYLQRNCSSPSHCGQRPRYDLEKRVRFASDHGLGWSEQKRILVFIVTTHRT